ncbi:MAG: sigma-70 factor domain-containing protein [Alphaproteobacteria bacterium]
MNKDFTLNGLDFSPEINLARYLQSIRKFPILTPENEYDLAVKYRRRMIRRLRSS